MQAMQACSLWCRASLLLLMLIVSSCSTKQVYEEPEEVIDYAHSRHAVYFKSGGSKVEKQGVVRINRMLQELSQLSNVKVVLRGYVDRFEKKPHELSTKRVESVKKALINSGILEKNNILISGRGYGKYDPYISYNTIKNNPKSRRVDMYIEDLNS